MLEKPDLSDEAISDCLAKAYGIHTKELTFLPIGYDAQAWVFSVTAHDGQRFFLKLRKGPFYAASCTVPRFLCDQGIGQIVAPLYNRSTLLSTECDGYALILYPLVEGVIAAEIDLSPHQRTEFGGVLAAIHHTVLPATLQMDVNVERYVPPWSSMVRKLETLIASTNFRDPIAQSFVRQWKQRRQEIIAIVERTEELGRQLQAQAPVKVLCHADIHEHNVLVDRDGGLHIVDWDGVVLAPKERDLMFIVDLPDGDVANNNAANENALNNNVPEDDPSRMRMKEYERNFLDGYGHVAVDPIGFSYYRYEWVVQEIGDCGERILLTENSGKPTRQAAMDDFIELFQPGDVVEGAYHSDPAK